MLSLWNTISGVTALNYMFEIGAILSVGWCITSIVQLRRSDRRMAELRDDSMTMSSQRMKTIESAAGGIRKELLDVQQANDILVEKLKGKDDEIQRLHIALEETAKKSVQPKRTGKETSSQERSGHNQEQSEHKPSQEAKPAVESKSALSREQRDQLIALLDPGPKGDVDILAVIGDDTSIQLAHELDEIFKADGWTTKGVAQSAFSRVPEGIVLSVNSKETAPSYASFIQRTMATIGFQVSASVNNKYREWSLTVIVGKVN